MKLRILSVSLVWLAVITALHVQLNVGWARLLDRVRTLAGEEREELVVGFLPVT